LLDLDVSFDLVVKTVLRLS